MFYFNFSDQSVTEVNIHRTPKVMLCGFVISQKKGRTLKEEAVDLLGYQTFFCLFLQGFCLIIT